MCLNFNIVCLQSDPILGSYKKNSNLAKERKEKEEEKCLFAIPRSDLSFADTPEANLCDFYWIIIVS